MLKGVFFVTKEKAIQDGTWVTNTDGKRYIVADEILIQQGGSIPPGHHLCFDPFTDDKAYMIPKAQLTEVPGQFETHYLMTLVLGAETSYTISHSSETFESLDHVSCIKFDTLSEAFLHATKADLKPLKLILKGDAQC